MGDAALQIKTDKSLIEALKKASVERPDAEELLEQRVSFIFGALKPESGITRERIKRMLEEQEGR